MQIVSQTFRWLSVLALCTFAFASIIILSLIPLYLNAKTLVVRNHITKPLTVIYRTDLINGNYSTIVKNDALAKSLTNALHLRNPLVNLMSEFQSIRDTINQGDMLKLQFALKLSLNCINDQCQNQLIFQARRHISEIYTNITVLITFTDGRSTNIRLTFCSFESYEFCSNQCVDNHDDSSDNIGYNPICQDSSGLQSDDCFENEEDSSENTNECTNKNRFFTLVRD